MSLFTMIKEKLHRKSLDERIDEAFSQEKTPFSQQVLETKQKFENDRHPNPMANVDQLSRRNLSQPSPLPQLSSLAESFRKTSAPTAEPPTPPDLMMTEPGDIGTHPLVNRGPPSMPSPLGMTDKAREYIGARQIQPTIGNEPAPRPIMKGEKSFENNEELLHEILEQQKNIISILREMQKHLRI